MGSIPLPALDIKPPQIEDPLVEFQRAAALKTAAAQQQQMAAQTQGVQQTNQMNAMTLKDEQLRRQLTPQFVQTGKDGKPTGFDNEGLYSAMLSQGADPLTIQKMRVSQAEMQKKMIDLGDANIEHHNKINDQLYGIGQSILDENKKGQQQTPANANPSTLAPPSGASPAGIPGLSGGSPLVNGAIPTSPQPTSTANIGTASPGTPQSLGQPESGQAPTIAEATARSAAENAARPINARGQAAYQAAIPQLLDLLRPEVAHKLPAMLTDESELDQLNIGLAQHKQQLADAKTAAETQKASSEAESSKWKSAGSAVVNTETGRIINGVPPVEQQELLAYLKNPALDAGKQKDAATYVAWKAKQSPMAMVMGNQLQGTALDQQAERFSQSGVLPSGFTRSPGTLSAIINRAAELHPDQNIAGNEAAYKSVQKGLGSLQDQFGKVSAFEGTALRNLDLYVQKVQAIPDLQVKFANVPLRMITGSMIGEQNYAAMQAARKTASAEVGKVLSSATGSGVLSDSQRKEAEDVLDGNLPLDATLNVVQTLKQDLANRHDSYNQEINQLRGLVGARTANQQAVGGGQETPTANTKAGGTSGLGVSLSAAKLLPRNKGKSDEEIKADIQSHGHSVLP